MCVYLLFQDLQQTAPYRITHDPQSFEILAMLLFWRFQSLLSCSSKFFVSGGSTTQTVYNEIHVVTTFLMPSAGLKVKTQLGPRS
jgi:hypothetical protein